MIFSRNRGNAGRRDPLRPGRHTRGRQAADEADLDLDLDLDFGEEAGEEAGEDAGPAERAFGPYDLADVPDDDAMERLDLGSLQIPAVAGVEIRLQAGPQGDINGLALLHETSQLQLGAYAAPRTEGIWDEIRGLILQTLSSGGARPEEVEGDYGLEVRARIRDESGATTIVRHVGIDGPRWFVHATYYGAAAADPAAAGPLETVLRGLVVNRGTDARPVKETLPMKLPPEAQQQVAAAESGEALATGSATPAPSTTVSANGATPKSAPKSARRQGAPRKKA